MRLTGRFHYCKPNAHAHCYTQRSRNKRAAPIRVHTQSQAQLCCKHTSAIPNRNSISNTVLDKSQSPRRMEQAQPKHSISNNERAEQTECLHALVEHLHVDVVLAAEPAQPIPRRLRRLEVDLLSESRAPEPLQKIDCLVRPFNFQAVNNIQDISGRNRMGARCQILDDVKQPDRVLVAQIWVAPSRVPYPPVQSMRRAPEAVSQGLVARHQAPRSLAFRAYRGVGPAVPLHQAENPLVEGHPGRARELHK